MKSKLKNLIVLCLMLFFCVFSGCLESDDKNGYNEVGSEGLIYALSSDSISYDVIGYNGTENNIIIPSVYKGLPVIGIRKLEISNSNIESIIIPNSIKNINDYAFSNLKSSLIIYCKGNINSSKWISDKIVYFRVTEVIEQEGITYAIINNKAVVTKYVGKDSKVEIPSTITYNNNAYNVTEIGSYSFSECTVLTSITIPNSVTSIGERAFYNCASLKSIIIPDSVESIGKRAFSSCISLTSITIPNGVESIGSNAFSGCTSLTIYCEISSKPSAWNVNWNVDNIQIYWNATKIIDEIIYLIIDKKAVVTGHIGSNREVKIPDTITYNNNTYNVTEIGSYSFSECTVLTSITIPNSVTSIGRGAFSGCTSLTSIEIPNSVESIGSNAFSNCNSLTSIVIPNSVTSIGEWAFWNCFSLTSITLPFVGEKLNGTENTKFGYIFGDNSYVPRSLKEVIITGDTSIGDYAFYDCESLTSITIPNSVESIGSYAFYNCESLKSIIIPDSVESIGKGAFSSCESLKSIIIPDSVESIGKGAFSYCTSLTIYCEATSEPSGWNSDWNSGRPVYYGVKEVIKQDGIQYLIIDGNAVVTRYVGKDSKVEIPSTVTYNNNTYNVIEIGKGAFFYSEITSVKIPDSVESIGERAFSNCTSLTSITIPNSVTSIGECAFWNCESLTSITIPNSVTSIGKCAFWNCESLTSITIPNSVTSIGESAFWNCESLTSITIPNSVTSIGYGAFYGCTSLTIYCKATSKPSGWDSNWNSGRPVYWN